MKVPIYKPELPSFDAVEPELREMFETGMLYPGKYTDRLVERVKQYCGVNYVMPVNSCSTGLIILLGILKHRGEVLIPGFTFNATLQAVQWAGHTPVCIDVDDNGQMRPDLVEEYLRTKGNNVVAVMPVHMWGNACYPEEYDRIAQDYHVPVMFDGAHVFGTTFNGVSLANFGTAVCFSIAATKPLSAGEGGLICTNQQHVFEYARHATFHGLFNSLDTFIVGLNGKIQEFNSILAYHAMGKFAATRERRAFLLELYRKQLADLPVRVWETREGVDASYKDCVIFVESRPVRDALEAYLNNAEVGTKRYFDPAVPDMGYFGGIDTGCDNSRRLANTCLTLPLYPALTESELSYVVDRIRAYFLLG